MESLLRSPRFAPTPTSSPFFSPSPLRLRSSLQLPPPPRHAHVRLCSTPGDSNATQDNKAGAIKNDDDLWTVAGKVLDAYRSSDNDLRTFLQNLVDAGLVDESELFGTGSAANDDDDLLRAFRDADLTADLGALWKLPALAAFSFAGVPALLGYLGDAAGVERVPAWMPLTYSLAAFLLGSLLLADASVGDEELEDRLGDRDLALLDSEEVLQRMTWRVPASALAFTAAGEAALRAVGEATGVRDLQPPVWVAFLLFGLLFGVPYGVLSASFDPAVQGSWLGWDEFVTNIGDVALRCQVCQGRREDRPTT
ncbi:hypothetical protein ACQ4PT_003008 [Festuca glaucescens]